MRAPHPTSPFLHPPLRSAKPEGGRGEEHGTKPHRPRALVLGPTRELTDQILKVAKSLSTTPSSVLPASAGVRHCMGLGGSVAFRTVWGGGTAQSAA